MYSKETSSNDHRRDIVDLIQRMADRSRSHESPRKWLLRCSARNKLGYIRTNCSSRKLPSASFPAIIEKSLRAHFCTYRSLQGLIDTTWPCAGSKVRIIIDTGATLNVMNPDRMIMQLQRCIRLTTATGKEPIAQRVLVADVADVITLSPYFLQGFPVLTS